MNAPHRRYRLSRHAIRPGVVHLVLAGEIDMTAEDPLRQALSEAVCAPGVLAVQVDLAAVTFLDSSGVNVLVKALVLAGQQNTVFQVVNATGIVEQVLQITGVLNTLTGSTSPARQQAAPHDDSV